MLGGSSSMAMASLKRAAPGMGHDQNRMTGPCMTHVTMPSPSLHTDPSFEHVAWTQKHDNDTIVSHRPLARSACVASDSAPAFAMRHAAQPLRPVLPPPFFAAGRLRGSPHGAKHAPKKHIISPSTCTGQRSIKAHVRRSRSNDISVLSAGGRGVRNARYKVAHDDDTLLTQPHESPGGFQEPAARAPIDSTCVGINVLKVCKKANARRRCRG
eukprot:365429-Chlamydomonas_euryale.AAC.20